MLRVFISLFSRVDNLKLCFQYVGFLHVGRSFRIDVDGGLPARKTMADASAAVRFWRVCAQNIDAGGVDYADKAPAGFVPAIRFYAGE